MAGYLFALLTVLLGGGVGFPSVVSESQPQSIASADSTEWLDRFVARLDPGSEPSRRIAELGANAARDEIIDVAANYFRNRPAPDRLWAIPIPQTIDPNFSSPSADKAVNHLLTTRAGEEQYGETLPWFSVTKELTTISRFPHFDYLAVAYHHTKDERYAATMVRDMADFLEHVPIEAPEGMHVQVDLRINPWNWVLLQWRNKRWIDALEFLKHSPSLSDEEYLQFTLHVWEEIDWLVPRKVLGLHNGTLGNVSAIMYAALRYPETIRSAYLLDHAGSFFSAFVDLAFYPREFLIELTLGYSEGTLLLCLDMLEGLPESNELAAKVRAEVSPKLEAIVDAHVGMMKPDRGIPRYGDHGIYDIRDRLLRRGGRLFDRPDLTALADNESDPNVVSDRQSFPFESNPYYLSGYYAMRDGWDVNANYLSMDAGPFGTNHHHGDKLSITVSGDGAPFIVDPGTALYMSVEPGPRMDLRPGFVHNNIVVDGVDVNTGWDRHYGFDVLENRWVTNKTYDFLEGVYEYRNNLLDVIWRRSVFFRKGEYWLLMDALTGEGSHHIESNFQTMVGTEVTTATQRVTARAPSGAQLSIDSAPGDGLSPGIVTGDTTARPTTFLLQYPTFVDWIQGGRGWVGLFGNEGTFDFTRTYPAPAIVYEGDVQLPHQSIRALSPSRNGRPIQRTVTWKVQESDHWMVEIAEDGTDVVDVLDWRPVVSAGPRVEPEDESGIWYRTVAGRVTEIIVMNQSSVAIATGGESLAISFGKPFEGVLKRSGDGWSLFADSYLREPAELTNFSVSRGRLAAPTRFALPVQSATPGEAYELVRR